MHRMLVISLFHHVESSSFCNRYYLFTLSFLSKQTRHGRNRPIVSCYFFLFICVRAKCLSREQCVGSNAKADALCSKSSLQVSRTVTSNFVWSWTIIVFEGIQDPGNWTQYSSFELVFLCLCLINCCTLDVGIIASVWGLPNSPS
jgi:hypothetical protein